MITFNIDDDTELASIISIFCQTIQNLTCRSVIIEYLRPMLGEDFR